MRPLDHMSTKRDGENVHRPVLGSRSTGATVGRISGLEAGFASFQYSMRISDDNHMPLRPRFQLEVGHCSWVYCETGGKTRCTYLSDHPIFGDSRTISTFHYNRRKRHPEPHGSVLMELSLSSESGWTSLDSVNSKRINDRRVGQSVSRGTLIPHYRKRVDHEVRIPNGQ